MMFSYAPRIAHFFECSSLSFKRRRRPSIQSGWCPFKKLNSHKRTYAYVVLLGSPRERPRSRRVPFTPTEYKQSRIFPSRDPTLARAILPSRRRRRRPSSSLAPNCALGTLTT